MRHISRKVRPINPSRKTRPQPGETGRSRVGKITSADVEMLEIEIDKPTPNTPFLPSESHSSGRCSAGRGWRGREAKFLQLMSRSVGVETINPTPFVLELMERSSRRGVISRGRPCASRHRGVQGRADPCRHLHGADNSSTSGDFSGEVDHVAFREAQELLRVWLLPRRCGPHGP